MAKKPIVTLTPDEISEHKSPYYVPGRPYVWVMGFGWCIVGYYVRHENPLTIVVAHANHFRNAKVDYGQLIREGPAADCEWRYEGTDLLPFHAIQRVAPYGGEVPRGRIRS
jgi:hypothetical protein